MDYVNVLELSKVTIRHKENCVDLRDFIAKAITDIVGGIQDAQKGTPADTVVPDIIKTFKAVETGISEIQPVEFQVTVRAEGRKGSEAKLNVVTAVIGGGVKGHSDASEGHSAVLKFKVPLRLPAHETQAVK